MFCCVYFYYYYYFYFYFGYVDIYAELFLSCAEWYFFHIKCCREVGGAEVWHTEHTVVCSVLMRTWTQFVEERYMVDLFSIQEGYFLWYYMYSIYAMSLIVITNFFFFRYMWKKKKIYSYHCIYYDLFVLLWFEGEGEVCIRQMTMYYLYFWFVQKGKLDEPFCSLSLQSACILSPQFLCSCFIDIKNIYFFHLKKIHYYYFINFNFSSSLFYKPLFSKKTTTCDRALIALGIISLPPSSVHPRRRQCSKVSGKLHNTK